MTRLDRDARNVLAICAAAFALTAAYTIGHHNGERTVHLIPPVSFTSPAPATSPASRDFVRPPIVVPPSPTDAPPARGDAQPAQDAGQAARPAVPDRIGVVPVTPTAQPEGRGSPTAAQWAALRRCESGDNYAQRANPLYRGAYQIGFREWANYGGVHDPADALPALQDARALQMWQARGWEPWSSSNRCSGLR